MKKLLIIIGVTIGLNTSIVAGPIHDAASTGDIDEIKSLLNIGVSVDHKDVDGRTALMYSLLKYKFEVTDFLVSVGADVNAEDKLGITPISYSLGDLRGVKLLIDNGADLNLQDKSGRSVLIRALGSSDSIIQLIIDNGAKISTKGIHGQTALHYAVVHQYERGVRKLIDNGADVNAKDNFNKTPADYSQYDNGDYKLIIILQQAGAKTGLQLLEEKVDQLSIDTTNPTDEWPRKMWEIDLGKQLSNTDHYIGLNKSILLLDDSSDSYWITQDGKSFRIKNTRIDESSLLYLDNKNLIYKKSVNDADKVILLSRNKELVLYNEANPINIQFRWGEFDSHFNPPIGVSKFGTKITGWDFTPPTSTAPKPDDGNGGGNETVNSRLIIKTAGPDISLATDGKLGEAELQKSNDLRSWRRLGDVPAEASEVLVTPRERGNEFYRLKKN